MLYFFIVILIIAAGIVIAVGMGKRGNKAISDQIEKRNNAAKEAERRAVAPEKKLIDAQKAAAESLQKKKKAAMAKLDATLRESELRTYRIVGVTFDNEDGTHRQELLRKIQKAEPPFKDDELDITLADGEYEGAPAIYVNVDGQCIGSIAAKDVPELAKAWNQINRVIGMTVDGGGFDEDGNKLYYGASITVDLTTGHYRGADVPNLPAAVNHVIEAGRATPQLLHTQMGIDYDEANKLISHMRNLGILDLIK